ncbi:putative quinol monooxygenase [Glaciibacter superstes]|uniref:putative quinol monooxygenase n=1 Tax=Glaciibacter superstes TaxID=501023 RepID=UPI0003B5C348|nr:antibiotic biosynthesis monooxygenase family protein [Glaciibacter superstes]
MTAREQATVSVFVVTNQMQAQPGRQKELVALLRRFATTMHAEPGGVHYSVHRPIGDDSGPLTVIQAYASVKAFQDHGDWMRTRVPELASLLAAAPTPPVLLEQVALSGHVRETFGIQLLGV